MEAWTIFEHKSGPILDEDGKRRYWEDDSPGWYFWDDGLINGSRFLYGPFRSEEEAEMQLEAAAT